LELLNKYHFHAFQRLHVLGKDVRTLKHIKIGAIGPKTAEAVQIKGIRADMVPDEYRAEALVDAFKKEGMKNLRILLPRAAEAREVLPEELKSMGNHVEIVEAYRAVMPETGTEKIRAMLKEGAIHMVTFTSSSTVTNFIAMFKEDSDRISRWMEKIDIACIGPITAKTAEENGLNVSVIPDEYTIEALTSAIVEYYS